MKKDHLIENEAISEIQPIAHETLVARVRKIAEECGCLNAEVELIGNEKLRFSYDVDPNTAPDEHVLERIADEIATLAEPQGEVAR